MQDRSVIFDVDGVLVDSYQAHYLSWQQLATEDNDSITEAQFAATFGRTSREIIAELWSDRQYSDPQISELDDRKEAYYREILQQHFPEMDGARELMAALHADGFRIAVGSSGPPENVSLVLDHVDRDGRVQVRVTGVDVTRGKPDPQVFLLAARRLEVPAAHCLVVEDAPAGIAAAHAAGMSCVGLVSTGRTHDELAQADLVIDSLRQLTPEAARELIGDR